MISFSDIIVKKTVIFMTLLITNNDIKVRYFCDIIIKVKATEVPIFITLLITNNGIKASFYYDIKDYNRCARLLTVLQ